MRRWLVALLLVAACSPAPREERLELPAMGTVASLRVFTDEESLADRAGEALLAAFDSVTASMNTWDAGSEISRLNRAPADSSLRLSPWLSDCLALAEEVRDASKGAFDPTAQPFMKLWGFYRREGRLPSDDELRAARATLGRYRHDTADRALVKEDSKTAFDLGGIAKGFAVARAAESLAELGVQSALIDLGGNLHCIGAPPGKQAWEVGVRDPENRERLFASLPLRDRAVATSGSYERFVEIEGRRYGHIMNPATGRPAEGLLSASAIAGDAGLADGLSTALFVLGPEGARRVLADFFPEVDAVLVLPAAANAKPRVLVTRGIAEEFELLPGYEDVYEVEVF